MLRPTKSKGTASSSASQSGCSDGVHSRFRCFLSIGDKMEDGDTSTRELEVAKQTGEE